jgi:osmotically-inducible protein OsmY
MHDLEVKTVNGEVILCGYVRDLPQKYKAEQIAENIEGVTKVTSYIEVSNKPPVNTHKPGGPRQKLCE